MVWVTKVEPFPKPARLEAVLSVRNDTSSDMPFGHWLRHIRSESPSPVLILRTTSRVGYAWGRDKNRQFPKTVIRVDEVLEGHPEGDNSSDNTEGRQKHCMQYYERRKPWQNNYAVITGYFIFCDI